MGFFLLATRGDFHLTDDFSAEGSANCSAKCGLHLELETVYLYIGMLDGVPHTLLWCE